jgi:glycosyltransferase involved in cell wall biosynthesis
LTPPAPLSVLAFLEAVSLTGPAKNLLQFAEFASAGMPESGQVQLRLVTYRRPGQAESNDFLAAAARLGVACEIIDETSAFDFRTLRQIRALVARFQPDVIQTHNVKSAFLVSLAGAHRRMPWIHWHHGYTTPTRKQALYNQLNRFSVRGAKQVVTVTSAFIPELLDIGIPRERIEVIPNAIRPDWGASAADVPKVFDSREKTVLAIGRLSKEKAHADLIEALALLKAEPGLPPVRLVLVGDGHERQNLEALAAARNVSITFAGQVSDVRPFYRQADLFVLPSLSEGSPNALMEAMAAGNPIVATAVGGVPETVTDGIEALLVPAANPAALSAAISKVIGNPDLAGRLSEGAKARVRREFLPEARARRIIELYRRVLGKLDGA